MQPIHIVILLVIAAFSWKLFTILRTPEIPKNGKRMAISIFVFSLISFAVAVYFVDLE